MAVSFLVSEPAKAAEGIEGMKRDDEPASPFPFIRKTQKGEGETFTHLIPKRACMGHLTFFNVTMSPESLEASAGLIKKT